LSECTNTTPTQQCYRQLVASRQKYRNKQEKLPRNLDEKLVDIEQSYRWPKSDDIKAEKQITIMATQGQAISTNCFKNKIWKEEIESKCWLCKQHEETIDHLNSE
jgi:Spy/CpxP family protein refolding chaperone